MAKKSSTEKQKKREKLVKLNWDKRQDLKKRSVDVNLSEEEKEKARLQLNKMKVVHAGSYANLVSHVSVSAKWLLTASFLALQNLAGKL
jgi:hypothetical protein